MKVELTDVQRSQPSLLIPKQRAKLRGGRLRVTDCAVISKALSWC